MPDPTCLAATNNRRTDVMTLSATLALFNFIALSIL
jgi:hypothetical protein